MTWEEFAHSGKGRGLCCVCESHEEIRQCVCELLNVGCTHYTSSDSWWSVRAANGSLYEDAREYSCIAVDLDLDIDAFGHNLFDNRELYPEKEFVWFSEISCSETDNELSVSESNLSDFLGI